MPHRRIPLAGSHCFAWPGGLGAAITQLQMSMLRLAICTKQKALLLRMAKLSESIDYILIAKDRQPVPSQLKPQATSGRSGERMAHSFSTSKSCHSEKQQPYPQQFSDNKILMCQRKLITCFRWQ